MFISYKPSHVLLVAEQGHVTRKLSSRGKYVSVNIGPIHVVSSEQVSSPLLHADLSLNALLLAGFLIFGLPVMIVHKRCMVC